MKVYIKNPDTTNWDSLNIGGGIPEAPADGKVYGRNGKTKSWEEAKGGSGLFKFDIQNGDLILSADDELTAQKFSIDENGSLIYNIE